MAEQDQRIRDCEPHLTLVNLDQPFYRFDHQTVFPVVKALLSMLRLARTVQANQ